MLHTIIMAPRRKGDSSQLPYPAKGFSLKLETNDGSIALDDMAVGSLIDRVSKDVFERLTGEVEAVVNRRIEHAVQEIRGALEDRILAVEETCKDIVETLQITEGKLGNENEQPKAKIFEFELAISRQEREINLVVSGVTENEDEDTMTVFLDLCKETLNSWCERMYFK